MTNTLPARSRPNDHPAVNSGRVGVLLVNLGTPDAPTPGAVRRYLAEFLSDRRVVDYPRALWLPILHGVILNVRPAKSAKAYAKIWSEDGSPLRSHLVAAASALSRRLAHQPNIDVDWAMRYGAPSIAEKIAALKERGCDRILVAPLYPQYSQSTSASVADAAFRTLQKMNWQPSLRVAPPFHDAPAYIDALRNTIETHLAGLDWSPERVVISFHGVPKRHLTDGDPYFCHCSKTARLLRAAMGWADDFAPLAFQSRFGREEWLTPATDITILEMAKTGVKRVAVVTPGFIADCLETLEEIAIEARRTFLDAGGEAFTAIPCLNDSPELVTLLDSLIKRETAGWIDWEQAQ